MSARQKLCLCQTMAFAAAAIGIRREQKDSGAKPAADGHGA